MVRSPRSVVHCDENARCLCCSLQFSVQYSLSTQHSSAQCSRPHPRKERPDGDETSAEPFPLPWLVEIQARGGRRVAVRSVSGAPRCPLPPLHGKGKKVGERRGTDRQAKLMIDGRRSLLWYFGSGAARCTHEQATRTRERGPGWLLDLFGSWVRWLAIIGPDRRAVRLLFTLCG